MTNIGFKEWTLICDALGGGRQSIIVRKGGIAEGRDGFRFQHPDFLLFPTLFHEQVSKLKLPQETILPAPREDGQHTISFRARVEWTHDVKDPGLLTQIAAFHLWQDFEIEKRFYYEEEEGNEGVSVAFVRIEKIEPVFLFPHSSKFGGCRSWVQLPEPPAETISQPVLDEETHRTRERELKRALGLMT